MEQMLRQQHGLPLSGARIVIQSDGTNKWISSGLVDLSQFTGNIHLGF